MPQASRCSHLTLSVDLWLTICFTLIVNLHYITLIVQRHFGSLEDRPLSSPTFVMFFNDTHITFTVHLTEYSPHILPTWRKMNQFSFIWIHRRGAVGVFQSDKRQECLEADVTLRRSISFKYFCTVTWNLLFIFYSSTG